MATTLLSGEEEKGSTALENPERYIRVEYSHATPDKIRSTDEINNILTAKVMARNIDSFFTPDLPEFESPLPHLPKKIATSEEKA
jgi:hypothetical protein